MKRHVVAAMAVAGLVTSLPVSAQPAGDPVRTLVLLAQPQAALPQEYQAAELIAAAWRQLGLQVQIRPLPSQQFNQIVWYERQRWDTTTPFLSPGLRVSGMDKVYSRSPNPNPKSQPRPLLNQ